ncbi:DUF2599 domain-containing protein [Pseudomonas fluorescens]|nr:DUF2599 domain-containing protein [Pseudomonas fluorescens]
MHRIIGAMLMTLPAVCAQAATPPDDVRASELANADSYIQKVERCKSYIASAQWIYRNYEWALSIKPTDCARQTPPEGTAYLWDELTRDYSNSRYWTNTHGLRHQLICHLMVARNKPEWYLEPWRPDVGLSKTVAEGCNHETPLLEDAP